MSWQKVTREFFLQPGEMVAQKLLCCRLLHRNKQTPFVFYPTETEYYGGSDDPASHAFRGPTHRNASMFLEGGHWYIYLSYGLHWCANISCGPAGQGAAVLLRAGRFDSPTGPRQIITGPGLVGRALQLTKQDNGRDLLHDQEWLIEIDPNFSPQIFRSPRIGISKAQEKDWRFKII